MRFALHYVRGTIGEHTVEGGVTDAHESKHSERRRRGDGADTFVRAGLRDHTTRHPFRGGYNA